MTNDRDIEKEASSTTTGTTQQEKALELGAEPEMTNQVVAANHDCDSKHNTNIDDDSDNKDDRSNQNYTTAKSENRDSKDDSPPGHGEGDENNDSSTLSTAFTISFEDNSANTPKKLFGIRDSIRKFAPPKPHTIEKPRASKSDSQDNSYMSIESAPGNLSKRSFHRTSANNASCRSSGRKSDSSRHSNISESAAFLIDKMMSCNQGESLSSIGLESDNRDKARHRSKPGSITKKLIVRSGGIISSNDNREEEDDEVDFCEDKSDNGTYIVGAEHESDAARKKIDELFGVVKAAEESIIASSSAKLAPSHVATVPKQDTATYKWTTSRERQAHINRLARGRNRSPSSSSSSREVGDVGHRARSENRQSRNSSCDRASKLPSSKTRRATSQSSRHSSHRGLSDGDTQSSRSSLHADTLETSNSDLQMANQPSLKFNRAFALRRARLGLGEPGPVSRLTPSGGVAVPETESPNISPRRVVANQASQRYGSGGQQATLNRNDGGRFSLRMKNANLPNRLSGLPTSSRAMGSQPGAIIDNYMNKVFNSKISPGLSNQISPSHFNSHHTSITMPYQSNDELEISSPSKYKTLSSKSNDIQRSRRTNNLSEIEGDNNYCSSSGLNYISGSEVYNVNESANIRATSSVGRRANSSGQLGALDCLVISAISSLSVKIRCAVCELMVDHAKRLPSGNETRSVVEEILPQLSANSSRPKSPTSIEEIDQSLHFDLAQTLKNLKKVEQIVDVMRLIANQAQSNSDYAANSNVNSSTTRSPGHRHQQMTNKQTDGCESNTNSEANSLSPV